MLKLFDSNDSYGIITKGFHFIRLFFLLAIYFCVYSDNLIGLYLFKYHKMLGMCFFVIILLNVVWRILNKYPDSKATSTVEKNIEYIVFFCIYLLLMVIPLLGLLAHYNYGNEIVFDIYHLNFVNNFVENVIGAHPTIFRSVMGFFHKIFAKYLILMLIGIHIFAVLFSIIIRKSTKLKDMF